MYRDRISEVVHLISENPRRRGAVRSTLNRRGVQCARLRTCWPVCCGFTLMIAYTHRSRWRLHWHLFYIIPEGATYMICEVNGGRFRNCTLVVSRLNQSADDPRW